MLKAVPSSIEAVNNKAWILHTYLGKSQEALELVLALQKRAVPVTLPCEFFDTLAPSRNPSASRATPRSLTSRASRRTRGTRP